ncbi:hypothetical protein G6F46_005044 [Rhizopus delemar]|uniref:Uncharacterized protein n=2 Tax=Rhizopus TaxID=4842 RepID=A0A9P6Z5I1_9FUNG|nr:hypothetical protein G6F55_003758 [Rhizopus delemar]KAG1546161.1 hypothetical protein G6F51_005037 [Rhizopus arrhizus]KAG1490352.1 hypothetical protein G6F54_010785 [Rhizopus delemar]KAG1513156.1 hypothetical protein G6F53_004644 [Rhizopus delemar]KAG1519354.1 hypothetical protein G6F52_008701 [Rhizopus delemar]
MNKGTETKYEYDPMEIQHDRSSEKPQLLFISRQRNYEANYIHIQTAILAFIMNGGSQPSTSAGTVSTTGTLASGNRIFSVKSSTDGIGWNGQYRERLEAFANTTHATTTHAYSLSKFIFLCALQDDANFDIGSYINKEFFSEIWLSLVRYRRSRVGEATARRRVLIGQYIQIYLDCTSYIRPELKYTQQSSLVEGLKIIVDPSSIELPFQDPIYVQDLQRLATILTLYIIQYTFEQNNIYYDAKANPCEYMMAFYHLARLFEALRLPIFNCFPLRRTWVPGYATIDSKTLCQNILERRWTNSINKMNLWAEIDYMNSAALRPQGFGVLWLRGTTQTDELEPYIPSLNAQQHENIAGRYVTIDRGRRGCLYCVHENSTADAPRTYRYTKPCQDKMEKTKKYRRIYDAVKPQEVQNAEATLVNSQSLNLQNFEEYLRNRALVTDLLQRHYTETTTNHLTTHPLHRKLKLSKYVISDTVFVMGNYSTPNTRYQEPMQGVGFRRQLKKQGFLVYLIDEFRTNRCYPSCGNRVEELREYLWNRDLAASLNMIHIVRNLRLNGETPEKFQRARAERRGPIIRRRRSEENEEKRVLPRTL